MTSKQRAYLRSLASNIDAIIQIGKDGIGENLIIQVDGALKKRELIKITVLETSPESAKDAAIALADATKSDVVQVIGRKIVLFRRNPQEPKIEFKK
ncbi:MAG: ribosome assembly RNA-binding protein YhbY [Acutalibacteraceae bacterium]|nr:ribosome assembly RNA-binding protein YhbY [Acutalibacteraceae bacterium]